MTYQEMKWEAKDGLELFARSWEPTVIQPKAVVCHVHGLGEHGSRYAHVAEALGRDGYIFLNYDLRGHGRSAGVRGHIDSIEDFMQDIDLLLAQAKTRYPGLPIFLYGHSLGGIQVLHYGLTRKPNIQGVVATSPGLHTALELQTMKILAVKLLGSLLPTTTIVSGLDPNGISRDKKVVQAYIDDPLKHDLASLGFGKNMLGVIKWTLEHAAEFPLPLLLMHGKEDAIAFHSSSVDFAAPLGDKCTLVLWDGGYHELQNDLEKDEVIKTLSLWMDARLHELAQS